MTKALKIISPTPVTNYCTSDGKIHCAEIDAIAHETFIAVKGDLHFYTRGGKFSTPPDNTIYEVVMALAKKYEFTPRGAA